MIVFFFSSRRRHTRWNCDWSSDVCSSDLIHNFDAIFGEIGEEGVVAALCDIRGEIGFELEQEVLTLGGLFFLGEGRGGEKEQKEKGYGDFVHRKFSSRSGGGFGYRRR